MHAKFLLTALIVCITSWVCAQQVFPGGGSGSYRLDYPGMIAAHHVYAPIGDNLTGFIDKGPNYQGPLQLGHWWTSALWDYANHPHGTPMYPYPMVINCQNEGFDVRHGLFDINGLGTEVEVHSAVTDARVGLNNGGVMATGETLADDYGDWHATLYQNYGGGNTLRMTASPGCPFMFFEKSGSARPTIFGLNKNIVTKSSSGNSFIFHVAPEGRDVYIAVFFPPGTGMGDDGAPYNAINTIGTGGFGGGWDYMVFDMPGGSNYFSIAVMSDISQATLDLYESKAFNFITDTDHSYVFDETASTLTTTFDVTTTNVYGGANTGTLQGLYKHQWMYSPEAAGGLNTGITYKTPRGDMQVINANDFTTEMTHYGMLPNLGWANTYDPVQMRNYIDVFMATVNTPDEPADGYAKDEMQELGTIAQIASQIGYNSAHQDALDALESRLTDWFTADDDWAMFQYSSDFNWLAHYPNGFTSSGYFIDMHFHMGYLIYGAAILARYRPGWAAQYGDMVEVMVRQVNDYRKDMTDPGNIGWFPYLRYFDPYAGHSWAGPDAADQESVSEALMFAYGTFLWGETVGNDNLRDLGALLYITEAETAKLYWFDVEENVNYNWEGGSYPQHHVTILRHRGGSYATYFSADDRWKHSIVLLPNTTGSLWQVWDSTQAQTMFSHLPAGGYPSWDEHGYFYNHVHAGFDPTAAVNAWNTYAVAEEWINPTFDHVDGDIPQLYQWVHTFDSVGVYDNTVQADIAGFSVFRKDSCKHYMVYMPPGDGPRTVNFTDGQSFNVPDDTVITYRVCTSTLPVTLSAFDVKRVQYVAQLNWQTTAEVDNDRFEIERSGNGWDWEKVGVVKGAGLSSDVNNYTFTDNAPLRGMNYYRLRQVDVDGTASYSPVRSVLFGKGAVSVYPNPTNTGLTISTNHDGVINAQVYDVFGRVVKASAEIMDKTHLDLSALPNGSYILHINTSGGECLHREVVVKE